jgi:hypothetical protein
MESVTIHPGNDLQEDLPEGMHDRLLDWLRSNGVDPNGVPSDREVVIDRFIDFWWFTTAALPEPEGSRVLERTLASGEFPLSHCQKEVIHPLPEDLAKALRSLTQKWADLRARVEARFPRCPNCGHRM